MITKTFEVRDRATFIPVIATKLDPSCEADRYLLARSGFGRLPWEQGLYVMVTRLESCTTHHGAGDWNSRTMTTAHEHIEKNFVELASGSVIDVEFILGETKTAKVSEATESW